jgi:tripartite-type tricarboxylate transporter receptor subunit TctC
MGKRIVAGFFTALLVSAGWAPSAAAQDNYPSKPIRLIVGFAAGGGNDILARILNQKLSEQLGQPVVVENRPGAGAIVATDLVAKAPADGYTLLVGASGAMVINPAVFSKLPYDTRKDFAPISMIASFPLFLVATPSLPARSVADLVAYAKANPGKANYAESSAAFRLATELFKMRTGAPMEHVSYRSSTESVTAVIKGETLMTIADAPAVSGQIKSGQVRALAITSGKRSPDFPDLPTLAEAGVPDTEIGLWSGIFAPAATPPAIVRKLEAELRKVIHLPEINQRLAGLSVEPVGNSSAEFARLIAADLERWTTVAKAANIKLD